MSLEECDVSMEDVKENPYICRLLDTSGLHVRQPKRVQNAYKTQGVLGLFHLFLSSEMLNCLRMWTNENRKLEGKWTGDIFENNFRAYVGLEIAMSLSSCNTIRKYWSNEMFTGSRDYRKIMSVNTFQLIRASLKCRDSQSRNSELRMYDPLWSVRPLLLHFERNSAQVAVPTGCSALDEATCRTKARTTAKSYLPS